MLVCLCVPQSLVLDVPSAEINYLWIPKKTTTVFSFFCMLEHIAYRNYRVKVEIRIWASTPRVYLTRLNMTRSYWKFSTLLRIIPTLAYMFLAGKRRRGNLETFLLPPPPHLFLSPSSSWGPTDNTLLRGSQLKSGGQHGLQFYLASLVVALYLACLITFFEVELLWWGGRGGQATSNLTTFTWQVGKKTAEKPDLSTAKVPRAGPRWECLATPLWVQVWKRSDCDPPPPWDALKGLLVFVWKSQLKQVYIISCNIM